MRSIAFILLLLISPNVLSVDEWDCSEAFTKCGEQQAANTKGGLSSTCKRDSNPPYSFVYLYINGQAYFNYECKPALKICEEGKPFEGWFPVGDPVGVTVCDGKCKVTTDGNPPVPGYDSGGVAADFVKGKTMAEPCEEPCSSPDTPGATCPIPDYDPASPDPRDCPDGYRPGRCDDLAINTACTELQGANGTWCYADLKDPGCKEGDTAGNCAPPGTDSPFPDNPDNPNPDNPNPGGDNPDPDGSDPNNPGGTGGTGGDTGGTGGTGGAADNSGLKGKDPDKDGNCDMGYTPTLDKSTNKTYCRPSGTSEPNADGNCSDGWMKAALDSRFCVKKPKQPNNCPTGQFYEEGTGCKANGDPCPKGKVQNPTTKECIIQMDITKSDPPKPPAITMFNVCKQPPTQLTPETIALCNTLDAKTKEAQAKKDLDYLEGLVKQFKDFVKSDTQNISVDKFDITQLYSGVFVPFESFIKKVPECPLATIQVSSFNLFGAIVDFSKIFSGEHTKLPCNALALVRLLFLLGVYYLGFRLIFKAFTGV